MTEAADAPLIELRGVTLRRGRKLIFDQVDLQIARGQITAVMGPSGTGKTTLLRMISGQLRPDAGDVRVAGQSVLALNRRQLYTLRRQMAMLFQSSALFTDLSVLDNVAFPLREHTGLSPTMIRDLALLRLESVGLRGAAALMPAELSGGMARRAALARALALDPQIMLYDEPFAGQDPITMGVLLQLIRDLHQALGMTSVLVSHDVHETAAIADWIYVLSEGRVIGSGTPQALLNSKEPRLQQFLQGLPDGPVAFHQPALPLDEELLGC